MDASEVDSSLKIKDDEAMFVNIPDKIKRDINNFFETEFIPALIGHIQPICPDLFGVPVEKLRLEEIVYNVFAFDRVFEKEQRIDLRYLDTLFLLEKRRLYHFEASEFIGAAIRLCNHMGKHECSEKLNLIVKGYITPDEHPDSEFAPLFV